jgi:hypothetical protein
MSSFVNLTRPVILAFLLAVSGCEKQENQTELTASMSDDRILRTIGIDPAVLRSERVQGKDGYSIVYTNNTNHVTITRSLVSGVIVTQSRPVEQKRVWKLGKP